MQITQPTGKRNIGYAIQKHVRSHDKSSDYKIYY